MMSALEGEIHILPEPVIDAVIIYWRQRNTIEKFVEDMREERFSKLEPARQLAMYKDYIAMQKYLTETARLSVEALDKSLGSPRKINSPAAARSDL